MHKSPLPNHIKAYISTFEIKLKDRPIVLDGNSYIDPLSNHWITYAIAHARFWDWEYEVPAKIT